MSAERDEMARIIQLSNASSRMKIETALHYANNLIQAGFGKVRPSGPAERDTTTRIVASGGDVLMSLPEDQYIKMTPQQARDIGMRLFRRAFEAEGEPAPSMIFVKQEDEEARAHQ